MEQFLKEFHLENPGCTPAAFLSGRANGIDSYSYLTSLLKEDCGGKSILDLACGDGTLIKKILEKNIADLSIVGVDMSAGELSLARNSISASNVEFIEARAQQIPLADKSLDFVFCHMALMLMDQMDLVIEQIHRCLRPGGIFSAVVGGKSE